MPPPAIPAIIFERPDQRLSPLTDLRPACAIRTGVFTLVERASRSPFHLRGLHAPHVPAALAAEQTGLPILAGLDRFDGQAITLLNGAAVAPIAPPEQGNASTAVIEDGTGEVIAARLTIDEAQDFLRSGDLPAACSAEVVAPCLLRRPWDVIRFRDAAIDLDLQLLCAGPASRIPDGVIRIGAHTITIDPSATIHPGAVLDASSGPIHIGARATIRPLAVIQGPASIGPGSTVLEHSAIRPHTVIGPTCKVAGEVAGVIFQGFANKAHDGFLGDSWVGEWVNLGAGTTGSNLLNTYTPVKARALPSERLEDTRMQFLGAIIGDHTKTAICTRLTTGSVIGTGCNIACSTAAPACLAPFTWLTDERNQPYRFERFLDTARAAMARRSREPSPATIDRLRELHAARA